MSSADQIEMIDLFVIEATRLTREGFKAVFANYDNLVIQGEAVNIHQSLKHPSLKAARVVLLEVRNNKNGFLDAFKLLRQSMPDALVVGHSTEMLDPVWVRQLITDGMKGYLTKNVINDELYFAVMQVNAGGMYFTPAFTMGLLKLDKLITVTSEYVVNLTLSEHEIETLNLVADGYTNRAIAMHLNLNSRTVEARRKSLLKKTNTKNTAALIKYAVQYGLLK